MTESTWRRRAGKWWREIRSLLIIIAVLMSVRSAIADWQDVPTGSMNPTIIEGDRIFVNKLAYDLKFPFTSWTLTDWGDPARGEIITFASPENGVRLVKRVVGVPGDRVELRDNRLLINGEPVEYSDLDREISRIVEQRQPGAQRFALEHLPGLAHPVMVTPYRSTKDTFQTVQLPDGRVVLSSQLDESVRHRMVSETVEVPEGKYLVLGDNRDNSRDSRYFGLVDRELIEGRAVAVVFSLDYDNYYLPRFSRLFRSLY